MRVFKIAGSLFLFMCSILYSQNWDDVKLWETISDAKSEIIVSTAAGKVNEGIKLSYDLKGGGWVIMRKSIEDFADSTPIKFFIKTNSKDLLELKLIDEDNSTFGRKISLKDRYKDWTEIVFYKKNLDYWWLGDNKLDKVKFFEVAVSGNYNGEILLDEIGFGEAKMPMTFHLAGPVLDPDTKLKGIGFRQRRDNQLIPEEATVIEYLKFLQDTSSKEKQLVPSLEDNTAHTFNNALVAMAFILKGERERAERILDFYAKATKKDNEDIKLQNFFYKGEARGFYQEVRLRDEDVPKYQDFRESDRWMGDMAWLLVAYKYYEKEYNSKKYSQITKLLKNLLISFYKPIDKNSGYIQHGWRQGDKKLHENYGHHEGNIDCYAALLLCGEKKYAQRIKNWLVKDLKEQKKLPLNVYQRIKSWLFKDLKERKNLPLDVYTWRVLAFGKKYKEILNIPEYDLRYRKIMKIKDKDVMGFYHGPDIDVNNIWIDGVGHIACAFYSVGDIERGNFYANQMDNFLFETTFLTKDGLKKFKILPYTVNREGGYEWVDLNKGAVSACVWYIFAKNRFNPLRIER